MRDVHYDLAFKLNELVMDDQPEQLRALMGTGAGRMAVRVENSMPLREAAGMGKTACVQVLLPHCPDEDIGFAAMVASAEGHPETLAVLLAHTPSHAFVEGKAVVWTAGHCVRNGLSASPHQACLVQLLEVVPEDDVRKALAELNNGTNGRNSVGREEIVSLVEQTLAARSKQRLVEGLGETTGAKRGALKL